MNGGKAVDSDEVGDGYGGEDGERCQGYGSMILTYVVYRVLRRHMLSHASKHVHGVVGAEKRST